MELTEITNLIQIRNYMNGAINSNLKKAHVSDFSAMVILIEKKINDYLLSEDFKDSINFAQAREAVREAAMDNNIKSGLSKNTPPVKTSIAIDGGRAVVIK